MCTFRCRGSNPRPLDREPSTLHSRPWTMRSKSLPGGSLEIKEEVRLQEFHFSTPWLSLTENNNKMLILIIIKIGFKIIICLSTIVGTV